MATATSVTLCPDCNETFGTIACEHWARNVQRIATIRRALTHGDTAVALASARALAREPDWYAHLERLSDDDPDLAGDLVAALTGSKRPGATREGEGR